MDPVIANGARYLTPLRAPTSSRCWHWHHTAFRLPTRRRALPVVLLSNPHSSAAETHTSHCVQHILESLGYPGRRTAPVSQPAMDDSLGDHLEDVDFLDMDCEYCSTLSPRFGAKVNWS